MEDTPIVTFIIAAILIAGLGYEIERRRARLRDVFDVFDREESKIAGTLEAMVLSGQLTPYTSARPA